MPNQKYTPFRDEENIEEDTLHHELNPTSWIGSLNIRNLITNAAIFIIGLVAGCFLSNGWRGSDDRSEQYSIVPCAFNQTFTISAQIDGVSQHRLSKPYPRSR
jgi:hypothetical protein